MKKLGVVLVISSALVLAACAGDPNRRAKIGAATGAVLGGVVGKQLGDNSDTNLAIGAAIGALAGGAAGNYMDKQHAALQERLAAEAARDELFITQLSGNALRIGVASDISFAVGKSELKFEAQSTFEKIANVLKDYDKTAIHLVGHTDSTGSDALNQKLSLDRAETVASFMGSRGVPSSRMKVWGRGESEPIATNDTDAGRARNRRVDIVIKPIIEGQEGEAFTAPPYLGQ